MRDPRCSRRWPICSAVRANRGLKEPRPGAFYRKGKAWLHFCEDRAGLFADICVGTEWQRFRVSDAEERTLFLAFVKAVSDT
jgi:hypothetical protein